MSAEATGWVWFVMLVSVGSLGVAALFIGLLSTGGQTVSRALGVPAYLGDVVQAVLLLVTLGAFLLQNFRIRWVASEPRSSSPLSSASGNELKPD